MRRPRGGRMQYVSLGRGGPDVSAVGLGMWQAGGKAWGSDGRDADCREAMERAVELGINLVDTAEAYGDGPSESVMSPAIRNVGRAPGFATTKVGRLVPHAEYCRREGVAILAGSAIGKGVLTGKYHDGKTPKDGVRAEDDLFKPANLRAAAPLIRELRKIGRAHGKTPGQTALAWLRRNRNVIPIPGAKRPSQAEENAGAAGWSLNAREVRTLGGILRRIRLDTF